MEQRRSGDLGLWSTLATSGKWWMCGCGVMQESAYIVREAPDGSLQCRAGPRQGKSGDRGVDAAAGRGGVLGGLWEVSGDDEARRYFPQEVIHVSAIELFMPKLGECRLSRSS